MPAVDDLRDQLSEVGLSVAMNKCEIYSRGRFAMCYSHESIRVSSSGTKILGTPIGQPEYVKSSCSDIALDGQSLCDQVVALNEPQSGMLLLRFCHEPHLNYLGRTVASSLMQSAALQHDEITRSTFRQLIKCSVLNDQQWLQATLPIRFGGFGMLPAQSISSISFVSSWARSLVDLPHSFPALESLINGVLCPKDVTVGGSIAHELQLSLPVNRALEDLLINLKKLQHKLSQEYFKQMMSSIQENSQSCHEASRFRSLQGKGAGTWLDSIPTSTKFALNAADFCLATRLSWGVTCPLLQLLIVVSVVNRWIVKDITY